MTRRLVQNFRGLHALLLQEDNADRSLLSAALVRLGLKVSTFDAHADAAIAGDVFDGTDVVFFDADVVDCLPLPQHGMPTIPVVAVIGLEAPTRLHRAFELGPTAVLYKPLRSNGIYPAVFFAANEHRRRADLIERMQLLEKRHSARRFVQKAVLSVMEQHKCDDEVAFRLLRQESMRQRITVEELSMRILASNPLRAVGKA
jgi:AmiR/NasT family two-component response regulator